MFALLLPVALFVVNKDYYYKKNAFNYYIHTYIYLNQANIIKNTLTHGDTHIGTDSMGAMEAIAPTAKKLWGRCPQVAPQEFCNVSFFETVK